MIIRCCKLLVYLPVSCTKRSDVDIPAGSPTYFFGLATQVRDVSKLPVERTIILVASILDQVENSLLHSRRIYFLMV